MKSPARAVWVMRTWSEPCDLALQPSAHSCFMFVIFLVCMYNFLFAVTFLIAGKIFSLQQHFSFACVTLLGHRTRDLKKNIPGNWLSLEIICCWQAKETSLGFFASFVKRFSSWDQAQVFQAHVTRVDASESVSLYKRSLRRCLSMRNDKTQAR